MAMMAAPHRLPDSLFFLMGLTACLLRASCHPHHVVKKDLRVDLSMPSLGVILSQRLRLKDLQRDQRSPWQYDSTVPDDKQSGDATYLQDSTENDAYDSGAVSKAWTHRGRFGQGMTVRTGTITFPTEHDHENANPDRRAQLVLRRWQNLMEPRETPPANVVMDSTRSPAKMRRRVDGTSFRSVQRGDSKLPSGTAQPSAIITSKACNCTELLTNDTFSTVVFLVPHSGNTAKKTNRNESFIREVIRASLSKSVQVERIYEKGCHCGRTYATHPSPPTPAADTETKTPASCVRNDSSGLKAAPAVVDATRLPKITSTEKVMPTGMFAGARMRLPDGRIQTTMAGAAGQTEGTKCPLRVFVKFPGEELPARAKNCRKLWLPEVVYKEQTFWECVDHGSADCGDRMPANSASRTLLVRESGSYPSVEITHMDPLVWFATVRKTHTNSSRTATSEVASRRSRTSTPLPKCGSAGHASQSASDGSTPELVQCTLQIPSNESWHLSFRIPFYSFENASKKANITVTPSENFKRHRHTDPAAKSNQTLSETITRRPFPANIVKFSKTGSHVLTTTHITKTEYNNMNTAQAASANGARLLSAWPMRFPQYDGQQGANNSLAFILMCAAALAVTRGCNGSSCGIEKRVAEPVSREGQDQRSTHYHLHDDYDFVWTRAPATSKTVSRSFHYRDRNGTAFPYPLRDSHASAPNSRRGGRTTTVAKKGTSLGGKTNIFREAAPSSKPGAAKTNARKKATTQSTTYLEIIFGAPGPEASRQRERLAYNGSFAEDDVDHRDNERRQGLDKQARSDIGSPGQNSDADQKASRPPGKRSVGGHGDFERKVVPPVNVDFVKSRFRMEAVADEAHHSECKEARCGAKSSDKSLLEEIVIREVIPPSSGDEYEYYYVDDEPSNSENSPDEQRYRSVKSFSMMPLHNQGLERKKRKVSYENRRFGGNIR